MEGSDSSIYGAIFEYNFSYNYQNFPSLRVPPRYVIAFRGTILTSKTCFSDVRHNLRCIYDTRFEHAMHAIHNMVVKHSDTSVWLAGHSLGADLALLAGKTMARFGFFLEAYIFNPPKWSIPLETLIKCEVLNGGIRFAGSLFKAGVAKIFKDLDQVQENDQAMNIVRWTPYLFVNPADPICSAYIGYFKNKTFMNKIGLSEIERIATTNPLRSLLVGKKETSSPSESLHPLPSAYMIVNKNVSHDGRKAHGLDQWWDPSFNGEYVFYQFNS
ncbi:unnamed protein product [Arabis nemorensis]|uniref:Fungal lipase-type domain-containing protein n=1 Tax=Arabis nemorensis TaxID=586526 RepID=A0A565CUK7_9BRAS|nr:unnamed protein product [Arabis nemorensis]